MVARKRISKVLLYQDGRQLVAHLGMVDDRGCMVYLVDSENTIHLQFADPHMSFMIADAEAAQRRAEDARDEARELASDALKLAASQQSLIDDLLEDGSFTRGLKGKFRERATKRAVQLDRLEARYGE